MGLAGLRAAEGSPEVPGLLSRLVAVLLLAAVDPTLLPRPEATDKGRRGGVILCEEVKLLLWGTAVPLRLRGRGALDEAKVVRDVLVWCMSSSSALLWTKFEPRL